MSTHRFALCFPSWNTGGQGWRVFAPRHRACSQSTSRGALPALPLFCCTAISACPLLREGDAGCCLVLVCWGEAHATILGPENARPGAGLRVLLEAVPPLAPSAPAETGWPGVHSPNVRPGALGNRRVSKHQAPFSSGKSGWRFSVLVTGDPGHTACHSALSCHRSSSGAQENPACASP